MRKSVQSLLLVLAGAALLHACLLTDLSLRYVKDGMRPFLICSGAVLLALGTIGAVRDGFPFVLRAPAPAGHGTGADKGSHGHDHSNGPRMAWLLFLPVLALLLYAPPALGSYTAARADGKAAARPVRQPPRIAPLAKKDPAPLSLTEFIIRARQERGESLKGHTVLMTGFVTPDKNGDWFLTRMIVNCCAADSTTLKIKMHGAQAPRADSWVTVTGRLRPHTKPSEPALDVASSTTIPAPPSPYADMTPQVTSTGS